LALGYLASEVITSVFSGRLSNAGSVAELHTVNSPNSGDERKAAIQQPQILVSLIAANGQRRDIRPLYQQRKRRYSRLVPGTPLIQVNSQMMSLPGPR